MLVWDMPKNYIIHIGWFEFNSIWSCSVEASIIMGQWRSYYGLKYSTNLPIILVFKVSLFCRQRNPFTTSVIPMELVDIPSATTPTHLPAHTHLPPPKGKQTVIWDHTPRFGSSVANNFSSLQTGSKYNSTARKGQWLAIISLEILLAWESQRWTGRTCPRKSCPAKFSKRHMTNIKCIVNVAFSRRHSAIVT